MQKANVFSGQFLDSQNCYVKYAAISKCGGAFLIQAVNVPDGCTCSNLTHEIT